MYNSKKLFLFICFFLQVSAWASDTNGDTKGNGGGAFVCINLGGSTEKAEVLDYIEAVKAGIDVVDENISVKDFQLLIDKRVVSIGKHFKKLFDFSQKRFFKRPKYLLDKLVVTRDHGIVYSPPFDWCQTGRIEFKQTITYLNTGYILINKEVFSYLSDLQKEILYLHEVIYSMRRELFGDDFSTMSRKLVGLLISSEETDPDVLEKTIASIIPKVSTYESQYPDWRFSHPHAPFNVDSKSIEDHLRYSLPVNRIFLMNKKLGCNILIKENMTDLNYKKIESFYEPVFFFPYGFFQNEIANVGGMQLLGINFSRLSEITLKVRSHDFDEANSILNPVALNSKIEFILIRQFSDSYVFEIITPSQGENLENSLFIERKKIIGKGICQEIKFI